MSAFAKFMADQRAPDMASDIVFADRGGRTLAMLGVIVVAEITINPAGRAEYLWACRLPMCPRAPQKARDEDAARRAVSHQVREWCEAAGLVVSESALRKLRGVPA